MLKRSSSLSVAFPAYSSSHSLSTVCHSSLRRPIFHLPPPLKHVSRRPSFLSLGPPLPDKSPIGLKSHIGLRVAARYKAPRHPIVLCHGLFGYDVLDIGPKDKPLLQLHYWRGIKEALIDLGCDLHIAKVPTVSSIRTRAFELDGFLHERAKHQSVNFIAHSMGGLDCRHLITHLSPRSYRVLSLTTIATPHHGSSFMDWIRDHLGVGYKRDGVCCYAMDHPIEKKSSLLSPLDAPAFNNLTRSYCAHFNKLTPDRPDVKYFSIAAARDVPKIDPLYMSHQIIKKYEGPNDGMVSLKSATWGQLLGVIDCDHWDLTKDKGSQFDAIELYLQLATRLYDEGF